MPDQEDSLGGETFSGEEQQDPAEQSLGDGATMGGDTAAHSLGNQSTFGDTIEDHELFDDGMKLEDLSERYTEEGVLGEGGMGEVILATDTRLNRKVAIKRIIGKAARSKTAVQRFLTEAQSIAALNHTNIVQIYEFGRDENGPFLIMECVQGGSLLEKCKAGPIELDEAVNIFGQLCDGLSKAHAAGIIHRDIKPANILMTEDGIPKLTDFGLAKDDTADTGVTMEGAVIGTLDFMPPEQRQGAEFTDHRSDLWSLAATFYQMLTGKSPKVINISAIPPKLQAVVATALEESKEDRFQSVIEMREAILDAHSGKMGTSRSLGEGECPQCATTNASDNKHCDECGASLKVECLSCKASISIWKKACRECGAQQAPLVEEALAALKVAHDQAESLLVDLEFEAAAEQSKVVGGQADSRLLQYTGWHEGFSARLESSRTSEYARLEELLREAHAHEQAYDYEAGLQTLGQVAPSLKQTTVSGNEDTADVLTERLTTNQSRLKMLERTVRERVGKREIAGLLPIVNELLSLKPDRSELIKLQSRLVAKEEAIATRNQDTVVKAKQYMSSLRFSEVISALNSIPEIERTDEIKSFIKQAEAYTKLRETASLALAEADTSEAFDTAITNISNYLSEIAKAGIQDPQLQQMLDEAKGKASASFRKKSLIIGGFVAAFVIIGIAFITQFEGQLADSLDSDNYPAERGLDPGILPAEGRASVKIGILHSLSGTMAISESSLVDAVQLAVAEINAAGGVLGREIKPVVVDPASDWDLFAEKAKQLIVTEQVAVTFGCWTSVSRKSVLPVFEEENALLFYPVQYEGEEQSLNIFYTGATPNQQLIPAAQYMMSEAGGSRKKFYLLGTDYVFPRTANKVLKAFLKSEGVADENIIEEYTPFHHQDYQTIVGKIKDFAASGDACVLSTINGDSNVPFYKEFANQGLSSVDCPIMAFSVAEDELRAMDVPPLVGHLAAWNYFQSVDSESNAKFIAAFKAKFGADRVTDDPIEAAYFGVYVWAKAAEKAGSFDVDLVREAVYGMEFDAPGGPKKMHPSNQHTLKPLYIGEILADGQFRIVHESDWLVSPDSYSSYLHADGDIPAPTGGPK